MFEDAKGTKETLDGFAQLYTMMAKLMADGEIDLMSPNRLKEAVAETIGIYPVPNMAVEHCTKAYMQAAANATAEGKSAQLSLKAGQLAYALTGATTLTNAVSGSGELDQFGSGTQLRRLRSRARAITTEAVARVYWRLGLSCIQRARG